MSNRAKQKSAQRGLDVFSTSQTARSGLRLRTRKGRGRVDQTRLGALQARALSEGGAVFSPWGDHHQSVVWPVAGRGRYQCIKPVLIGLQSGEDEKTPVGSFIELQARCRRCDPCRKAKSAWWKQRAMTEIVQSQRTWFVTLTWRPEDRLRADYSIKERGLDPMQLYAARLEKLAPSVTKWLQRMRKGLRTEGESSVSFRYLLVWEDHKDGYPHAHLLIHEKNGQTLTKRRVQREWKSGFSNCRLVEGMDPAEIHKSAAYVCKYIAKSMLTRARASVEYGLRRGP